MPNVNRQTIYQMGNVVNDVVRQATGRDPVQAISMDYVTVEQNTLMGIETQSGAVVTFNTPKSVPLLTLVAQIAAQQNLHGYDYAWPGGGGKNKFPVNYSVKSSSVTAEGTNIDFTPIPEGVAAQQIQYSFSGDGSTTYTWSFYAYSDIDGTVIGADGQPDTGSSGLADDKLYTLSTTPQRFSNTGVLPDTNTALRFYRTPANTNPEAHVYISDIQIEAGTTATDYAPYSNICPITGFTGCNISVSGGDIPELIYPVDWETEAGTVYGGTYDAVNGKLTVTHIGTNLGDLSWSYGGIYGGLPRYSTSVLSHAGIVTNAKCDIYRVDRSPVISGGIDKTIYLYQNRLYVSDSAFPSGEGAASALRQYVTDHYFVYEINVPIEYEVPSLTVNTRAGENVMSANTGDISLSYYVYHDLL